MQIKIQDQSRDELVRSLEEQQQGHAYGAEGTCLAGRYIYAIVRYFVPFSTEPVYIDLSGIAYTNCQNISVFDSDRFGFVVRAEVIADGGALLEFDWFADLVS